MPPTSAGGSLVRRTRPVRWRRAAAIGILASGVAGWWAAAASFNRSTAAVSTAGMRGAPEGRASVLEREIERLHGRGRPAAAPRKPLRNLFAFVRRPAARAAVAPPALTEPAASGARPQAAGLKLSGIAEDATPSGIVRTAIISSDGQLYLVKEGENVTRRFRVARISSDVVELSDLSDGTVLRLALK